MLRITTELLEFIKHFEGCSYEPYLCPAGYWTIGYGHVIKENTSITKADVAIINSWLRQDVAIAAGAVTRLIKTQLSQNQFEALVSFTFNLGAGALQRSTLRRLVNAGDHEAVPAELAKWVWAGGRKLPGLIKRRLAEAGLYCQL